MAGGPGSYVFGAEEKKELMDVIDAGALFRYGTPGVDGFQGKVATFEKEIAEQLGHKYVVATSSGTGSLMCCLAALGIGMGDEVIVPGYTFIASISTIAMMNAVPVLAEIDDSLTIDPTKIEALITPRTKAIVPVHMLGNPCKMDQIMEIAKKHNLKVIEDCAQCIGGKYRDTMVGLVGDVGCYSFCQSKHFTTGGEGGMVVTNNEDIGWECRSFRDHGYDVKTRMNMLALEEKLPYIHNRVGFNYRMSNVVAAIGLAQTEKADEYKAMRMHNNELYRRCLADVPGIRFQTILPQAECVSWMNTIVLDPALYGHTKDELIAYLRENNVDSRLLFNGMHRQKSLLDFGCDCSGEYPICDMLTENGFYLPSASSLNEDTICAICQLIKDFAQQ